MLTVNCLYAIYMYLRIWILNSFESTVLCDSTFESCHEVIVLFVRLRRLTLQNAQPSSGARCLILTLPFMQHSFKIILYEVDRGVILSKLCVVYCIYIDAYSVETYATRLHWQCEQAHEIMVLIT